MSVPEPVDRRASPFSQFARRRLGTLVLVAVVLALAALVAGRFLRTRAERIHRRRVRRAAQRERQRRETGVGTREDRSGRATVPRPERNR